MKNKKQLIFQEAAGLFRDKGYSAASMRDLADRVGLKPSSFYNHIKSKEEILQKICFDNAGKFTEGMQKVQEDGGSSVGKLKLLIRLHIQIAFADPSSVTVFNDEWKHLSEPHLSRFLALRRDYEAGFFKIIQDGVNSGELKPINPSVVLYTIINSLRWLHYGSKASKELTASQIEKDLTQLFLTGLKL